ncbi:MAG: glucosaminidase domain-containing protein [Gammaproteobacteria bacterium]|nr:glucosaminidase domain-containing protein [Gammaproteobacteria bacterium]
MENVFFLESRGNMIDIIRNLPKDFPKIRNANKRKKLFILGLLPIVEQENLRIREQRNLIKLFLKDDHWPQVGDRKQWLNHAVKRYRINTAIPAKIKQQLLLKVDEIPAPLVIAQAALESGWGTSRFALEGNSLFGQWTFAESTGLVPEEREDGETHRVKAFNNISESVRAYMQNINTHHAYRELRNMRQNMRKQFSPLDSYKLASGLNRYSQMGDRYVRELRSIMNSDVMMRILTQDTED